MSSPIKALWLRRLPYLQGLSIQEKLFEKINNDKHRGIFSNHFLCIFEHDPIYTVGLRGHLYSQEEEDRLRSLGADFVRSKRGGMITFHGPGQMVVYPMMDLKHLKLRMEGNNGSSFMGVKKFVSSIEEVLIQLLNDDLGIQRVGRTEDTGVWVDSHRKIAAIGIQVRHGITSHGLALNCNTDLRWFDNIVPCGIEGKESTSISRELSQDVSIPTVVPKFCKSFESIFDCNIELINCPQNIQKIISC